MILHSIEQQEFSFPLVREPMQFGSGFNSFLCHVCGIGLDQRLRTLFPAGYRRKTGERKKKGKKSAANQPS
jgi:hypothetical protein